MVNVPKQRNTYCKRCKHHTLHRVSQYKQGAQSLVSQGKRRYDRKQKGYGGQTKPIFRKKAKITKKIVLKLECSVCNAKSFKPIRRCKHFQVGGDKRVKNQVVGS
jgi:large subunit ribosomal protein L44e